MNKLMALFFTVSSFALCISAHAEPPAAETDENLSTMTVVSSTTGDNLPEVPEPEYSKRLEAAKAYENLTPPRELVEKAIDAQIKNPKAHLTKEDADAIKESINYDEMEKTVTDAMARTFTVEELNAMTQFYGSPVGRSVMKKMPQYTAAISPYIKKAIVKAVVYRQVEKRMDSREKEQALGLQPQPQTRVIIVRPQTHVVQ